MKMLDIWMGEFFRGLRNVYRSRTRAALAVLILGLSVAVSLVMLTAQGDIQRKAQALKAEVQTLITVRLKGTTGMGGAGFPQEYVSQMEAMPNVVRVEAYVTVGTSNPDLSPQIAQKVGAPVGATLRMATMGEIRPPEISAGRPFTPEDAGKDVAIVGKVYAESRGIALLGRPLRVGDTFDLGIDKVRRDTASRGQRREINAVVEVIGIFESGTAFGDNQVFLPLSTAQRIYQYEGISTAFVQVDSVENVKAVADRIEERFPELDTFTGEGLVQSAVVRFRRLEASSAVGSGISLLVSALVVFFTMMLIVRERTVEIGTLKALGASNGHIARQFLAEVLILVTLAAGFGLVIYLLIGPTVGAVLLRFEPQSGVSASTLLLIPALILGLGLLGSAWPILRAVRLSPAEAIRHE